MFKQVLFLQVRAAQNDWLAGRFAGVSTEESALKNAEALGQARAYQHLLGLTYEEVMDYLNEEQEDEGKPLGAESQG